jgi:xanthine dehydrogenase molybdopterin-binding subunit B
MYAKHILAVLAVVFVVMAMRRLGPGGGGRREQARTWFLVGAIFGAVSLWLFSRGS